MASRNKNQLQPKPEGREKIKQERKLHARTFLTQVLMPIVSSGQELTEESVTVSLREYRDQHKGTEGERLALAWVEGEALLKETHGEVLQNRGEYVEQQGLIRKTLDNLYKLDTPGIDWRFEFGTEPPKAEKSHGN